MSLDLSHLDNKPLETITEGNLTKILLTNSNMSMFQSCRWKYWVRQMKFLVPTYKDGALSFGSAYHNGIENYYKGLRAKKLPMNALDDQTLIATQDQIEHDLSSTNPNTEPDHSIPTRAKAMVKGFISHYKHSPYQIEELETPFLLKMEDAPDFELDGHKYEFWLSGQMDALMRHTATGVPYIGEWKTCTQFADFISKVKVDNQPWHYMLCRHLLTGEAPGGVVYRIARKSLIRQKKDESTEDFFGRIIEQYTTLEKEHYHEEIIYYEPRRIDRHIEFLNQIALDIRNAIVNDLWYRHKGACFNYNKPCGYMKLCNTYNEGDFNMLASAYYAIEKPNNEITEDPISA